MKSIRFIPLLMVTFSAILCIPFSIHAAPTGATGWYLTDGDASAVTFNFGLIFSNLNVDWEFGIYELNNLPGNRKTLLSHTVKTSIISYTASNNISIDIGVDSGSGSLDVDGKGIFGLFYLDKNNPDNNPITNFTTLDQGGNSWRFLGPAGAGGPVWGFDMAPIPIPSALIILGSGLIAFIGIRRKFN